ncbi:hypothetical protein KFL_004500130 [Klebsormidium nitens]|uniref:Uncharacterized protein n=1 Tax=Klebsormidium nitens TaxID=105231 RepID=A0A1Y1IDK7_KLENI|nr:hypothetical protein KFL_004500130 [Klebsormidium nitens]|eukprot:GAQ88673.1 hypothetical protein KFL_004500130 [Klebsormidium nitens]
MSHSIWGFKLLGNNRVVTHSPSNMRVALTFEGKDKYSTYLEYLQPFLEQMDSLANEGLRLDETHYTVTQTLGADYVLMAELLGHSGASSLTGCCFCEKHRDNYGKLGVVNGKKVPLPAKPRTTESMAAATHRPWRTGPDVECPYCHEKFPNQAAVDASVPPTTKQEIKNFQQSHAGMRFGTPPIFKFPLSAYAVCILHLLLRLMAITFQQTVAINLNTPEKTDAANALIKALHLGVKKLEQRTTSGEKKKDTQEINFIGREARVLLHPKAYNAFLDIAIDDDTKRAEAAVIWDNLAAFYNELLQPLQNPENKDERLAKASVVQDKGVAFVDSFTAQVGAGKATLYCHLAVDHVPDMVARFPVNFSDMSQQFVEHKLKEGKTDMQLFTNRRLVDERVKMGRNQQVMAKGRERLNIEREVPLPPTRNERSRSKAQLEKKLEKWGPDIARVYTGYKEIVEQLTEAEESTGEDSVSARLMVLSENRTPGAGIDGPVGESQGPAPTGGAAASAAAPAGAAAARGGAAGPRGGAAGARGPAVAAARGGRGGGRTRGRGRGRGGERAIGPRVASSARPI